jgi:alkylation response protein AidB-like acyl-CoA dehydrogenase
MVVELDDRLRSIREEVRGHAPGLRDLALAVDAYPEDMTAYLDRPAVRALHRLTMPAPDGPGPSCLERVVGLAEAARADAGVVLACPGPSLAGVVVELMADESQKARFYSALADGRSWAFCAITEPDVGSDAGRMRAGLRPDGSGGYLLSGVKRYIGNGSRGTVGVVFARTGPSPHAIRAALVEAPAPGLSATPLDMLGLRGARIAALTFTDLPVAADALLGGHLSAIRRGMWAAIQAFNNVRVQVGAMALGTAEAVHDYVRSRRPRHGHRESAVLAAAEARIEAVRDLLYRAAAEVDAGPDAGRGRGYLASLAKLESVALARRATTRLPRLLGRGALLEHPLLEKWCRDAAGFEFMEGTSNIQRLNVAQGYLGRVGVAR